MVVGLLDTDQHNASNRICEGYDFTRDLVSRVVADWASAVPWILAPVTRGQILFELKLDAFRRLVIA